MTTPSSSTDTDTLSPLTALGTIAILVGIVAFIVSVPTDSDPVRIVAIIGLLGGLALAGLGAVISRGAPAPAAAPAAGLVGSRISHAGTVFTVLDDSAAVNAAGRRASVIAREASGAVGLLFVGFDAAGAVCEARVDGQGWAPAAVID